MPVTIRSTLTRCLVLAACLGLLVSPVVRGNLMSAPMDAMAAGTAAGLAADAGAMAGMPCCPEEPPKDCGKTCPLMALCATQLLAGPGWSATALPSSIAEILMADEPPLTGLDALPGRKPPRLHA